MRPTYTLEVPFAAPEFVRALPEGRVAQRTIDLGENIVERADDLATEELDEAIALLLEDGLLPADWMPAYLDREWPGGVTFTPDSLLRTAVKFGWSLETSSHDPRSLTVIAVDGTERPTLPHEHIFLAVELERRDHRHAALALRLPGRWEPGIDFLGDATELERALSIHAAIAHRCGPHRLAIRDAAGKFSALPILARTCRGLLHVDLTAAGWLEAMRLFARLDPRLLRDALVCAQMHFGVFRSREILSLTEEDVRSLPEVGDAELEAFFIDDPRGRQLLHVGQQPILMDPGLRERLAEALHRHADPYRALLAECVERHLSPFDALG